MSIREPSPDCFRPLIAFLTADADGEDGQTDVPVDSPEEKLITSLFLKELLAKLDARDRLLIELRYFRGMTQTETARELGMTQVGVSRREKKLLAALRQLAE